MVNFFKWIANHFITAIIAITTSIIGVYFTLQFTAELEMIKGDLIYGITKSSFSEDVRLEHGMGYIKAIYLCNIQNETYQIKKIASPSIENTMIKNMDIESEEIPNGENYIIVYSIDKELSFNLVYKQDDVIYTLDHTDFINSPMVDEINDKTGKNFSRSYFKEKIESISKEFELLR